MVYVFVHGAADSAMVRDRLGLVPDEIDSGHGAHLSNPAALADRLAAYVS